MAHMDRLRDNIDAGRTGDKVAFPDPAAAPLGTDDEAAGTPASKTGAPSQGAKALRTPSEEASLEWGRPYDDRGTTMGRSFPVALAALLAGIGILAFAAALVFVV